MSAEAEALLGWYDRARRDLPWRAAPGGANDPYRVWLSEVMLQQTTVAAVIPYFHAFLASWPTVSDLAAASLDEVLRAWAGLGYYARARNLHACACHVASALGGRFPDTEAGLRALPGIGVYTAAAVAAIAYNLPATVVDGNVERVVARLFAVTRPLPGVKPELHRLAATLTPQARPGDYAQGMMDLGATICTPRRPRCLLCPFSALCQGAAEGIAETLPRRAAKTEKPVRHGVAYWLTNGGSAVWMRRRPESGLLGGMVELPSTDWNVEGPPNAATISAEAPASVAWRSLPGLVRHTFTHFHLSLAVVCGQCGELPKGEGFWVEFSCFGDHALPTVMRKLIRHAREGQSSSG